MPTAQLAVSLGNVSFTQLKRHYEMYCLDGTTFRQKVGANIKWKGIALTDGRFAETNTCALRLSYALHRAGLNLPDVTGRSWTYTGRHRGPAKLPSVAADYKDILLGEKKIKSNQKIILANKQGIVLFLAGANRDAFGATGHVTLFEGLDFLDNGDYFADQRIASIWYWEISG